MKDRVLKVVFIGILASSTLVMAKEMSKMDLINEAKKEVGEITPQKLKYMLDEGEDVIVLDVRESEQRSEGSIPYDEFNKENFHTITRGNLEWKVDKEIKDKDAVIVTYCRRGGRGALAAEVLRKMGYKNTTTLKGGLKGWAKAGYPVKTGLGNVVLKKEE
jgi:rhodanese-related sulfurtransferase